MEDKKIRNIVLEDTVPPLRSHYVYEKLGVKSHITSAIVHTPDGCNKYVHVTSGHGNTQMLPTKNFLALNDTTDRYRLNEEAGGDEEVWAIIENHDVNPHYIAIIIEAEPAG